MSKFRNYDKYEVFEDGQIYSYKSKKFLKPQTKKDGYKQVVLFDNEGKPKTYLLHRVVWESVTGSPIPKGYEINHISEAKDENFFENLQLLSHKQNVNYGSRNSRAGKSLTKVLTNNQKLSKPVGAFKDGKLVFTFPSTSEAQRQGFKKSHISACCRGKSKTHRGFQWKYL